MRGLPIDTPPAIAARAACPVVARLLALAATTCLVGACESTNHDNIDKWKRTEKGPGKLNKAFADESSDADLAAHAGANLVEMNRDNDMRAALDAMSAPRRVEVIAKMAPRLWRLARVENERAIPGTISVSAKDALFSIRKYADAAAQQQIDGYLIDWFCVPSYVGRAQRGSYAGATVLRAVGVPAGKKMIEVTNGILAAPGQEKKRNRIDDELLLGLAVTQDPAAVKYVLDLATMDRGDETLPVRAMSSLFTAYVSSRGVVDVAPPAAIEANLDRLVAIAKDDRLPGEVGNDAIALIRIVGSPKCVAPLVGMVAHPHGNSRFKYVVATKAIECGGAAALKDVVRALPRMAYDARDMHGSIVEVISKLGPRDQVLGALRELLADPSPIARWVAIECLAAMKSTDDVPRIAALERAGDRLAGYWGESGKPEPTLGQRAKELVEQLKGPK